MHIIVSKRQHTRIGNAMVVKRRWCSGNISDFHSEAPVSITGRRKIIYTYLGH